VDRIQTRETGAHHHYIELLGHPGPSVAATEPWPPFDPRTPLPGIGTSAQPLAGSLSPRHTRYRSASGSAGYNKLVTAIATTVNACHKGGAGSHLRAPKGIRPIHPVR
jgi:hypothetical protein